MADKNHEMWENLGMDLETHDQLCSVLPTAFGDVFLSQENRPAGMDYFNMPFVPPLKRQSKNMPYRERSADPV